MTYYIHTSYQHPNENDCTYGIRQAVCLGALSYILDKRKTEGELLQLTVETCVAGVYLPVVTNMLKTYYSAMSDVLPVMRALHSMYPYMRLDGCGPVYFIESEYQSPGSFKYVSPDLHHACLAWQLWRQPQEDTAYVLKLTELLGVADSREEKLVLFLLYLWRRAQQNESAQYGDAHSCISAMTDPDPMPYGTTLLGACGRDVMSARVCRNFVNKPQGARAEACTTISRWMQPFGTDVLSVLGKIDIPEYVLEAAKNLLPAPMVQEEDAEEFV